LMNRTRSQRSEGMMRKGEKGLPKRLDQTNKVVVTIPNLDLTSLSRPQLPALRQGQM
jgi:hypothetical protein